MLIKHSRKFTEIGNFVGLCLIDTMQSLTGKYRGLQGNPCNESRDPAIRTGVPCNENRFFAVSLTGFGFAVLGASILDVLWGQPIKLIQVVSTSEFHEY